MTDLLKVTAMSFLFIAGILLAGSDGDWFPWANLFGAALLLVAGVVGSKMQPPGWSK